MIRCDAYGCEHPTGTDPAFFEFCKRHEYLHRVFRAGAHRRRGLHKRSNLADLAVRGGR